MKDCNCDYRLLEVVLRMDDRHGGSPEFQWEMTSCRDIEDIWFPFQWPQAHRKI